MRSLTDETLQSDPVECICSSQNDIGNEYEHNLNELKALHHSQCLFNRGPGVIPGLSFRFDSNGVLHGKFTCSGQFQGYDRMVHGGVTAAIIDASMAQCLMGHRIIAYTAELNIRYKAPVHIYTPATLQTSIVESHVDMLYIVRTELWQESVRAVIATAKFFKARNA